MWASWIWWITPSEPVCEYIYLWVCVRAVWYMTHLHRPIHRCWASVRWDIHTHNSPLCSGRFLLDTTGGSSHTRQYLSAEREGGTNEEEKRKNKKGHGRLGKCRAWLDQSISLENPLTVGVSPFPTYPCSSSSSWSRSRSPQNIRTRSCPVCWRRYRDRTSPGRCGTHRCLKTFLKEGTFTYCSPRNHDRNVSLDFFPSFWLLLHLLVPVQFLSSAVRAKPLLQRHLKLPMVFRQFP